MYKNEFDNNLKKNKLFNAYMFYGQCNYLIDKYTQDIASSLGQSDEIEKVYYDEYDFKYCKNRLLQSSLFTSKNILIIKLEKKIPKSEVNELIDACRVNSESFVIFSCFGDSDFKSMGDYFSLKTNSVSVRFFAPFSNDAIKILEEEAKKLNMRYKVSALNHLYFMHRSDLALCVNDLIKLSVLDETISSKLVDLHCFGFGSVSLEEFMFKLLSAKNIDDDLNSLLEEGANEVFLLTQISSFVQQLFIINAYARAYGEPNAKEILGFAPPPKIWQDRCRLAISIHPIKYQEVLEYLSHLEIELKSSTINDSNSFLQSKLRCFNKVLLSKTF